MKAGQRRTQPARRVRGTAAGALPRLLALVRTPVTGRARREFLVCLCGLVLGVPGPLAVLLLLVLLVAKGAGRRLGRAWRARAARLLNESFAPVPPPDAAGFSAALRGGPTWRAAEYLALPQDYTVLAVRRGSGTHFDMSRYTRAANRTDDNSGVVDGRATITNARSSRNSRPNYGTTGPVGI